MPTLHFDVYGWIGLEIGHEPADVAKFIAQTAEAVAPFRLNIESPADYGSSDVQMERYAEIVGRLKTLGSSARIVVDEHCNTVADIKRFAKARAAHLIQVKTPDVGSIVDIVHGILACKANGVGAFVGGSCVETDLSARVSTHIAVATQADMMLAKPGMGVDEGMSIVGNEQSRLLALLRSSRSTRVQLPL